MLYNVFMYILSSNLIELPIISLQSGQLVSKTKGVLIDSSTLTILALICEPNEEFLGPILLIRDIREFAIDCILINSDSNLSEAEDIVRLRPLIEKPFVLMNIRVATEAGRRLGRVEDYTVDTGTFMVQKIYVHPTLLRGILGSSLIIDRSQITDISPKLITVKESTTSLPVSTEATRPIKS